jgi:hypothetical protein
MTEENENQRNKIFFVKNLQSKFSGLFLICAVW